MNVFSKKIKVISKEKKMLHSYDYKIDGLLETIYTNDKRNNIYLCFYYIDKKIPILQYLLNNCNDNYDFFKTSYCNIDNIKTYYKKIIETIFTCDVNETGYKIYNKNIYIFFECSKNEEVENSVWCILDEICNKRKYLDNIISENTTHFFLNNKDFIYLTNQDKLKIESPIIAFQHFNDELELMYFRYSTKSNHYYDYENCNKKYIARYILFITNNNIVFDKPYQYMVNYKCKPISIYK